jgi:hypothetical protein
VQPCPQTRAMSRQRSSWRLSSQGNADCHSGARCAMQEPKGWSSRVFAVALMLSRILDRCHGCQGSWTRTFHDLLDRWLRPGSAIDRLPSHPSPRPPWQACPSAAGGGCPDTVSRLDTWCRGCSRPGDGGALRSLRRNVGGTWHPERVGIERSRSRQRRDSKIASKRRREQAWGGEIVTRRVGDPAPDEPPPPPVPGVRGPVAGPQRP